MTRYFYACEDRLFILCIKKLTPAKKACEVGIMLKEIFKVMLTAFYRW